MKSSKGAFYLLVSVAISAVVNASEWIKLGDSDSGGSHIFIDAASIAKAGGLRKAWFRWEYDAPEYIPLSVPTYSGIREQYRSSKNLSYFNCPERTSAAIQEIYYSENGKVLASSDNSPKLAYYSETAPDTVGEVMLNAVCTWKFAEPTKSPSNK